MTTHPGLDARVLDPVVFAHLEEATRRYIRSLRPNGRTVPAELLWFADLFRLLAGDTARHSATPVGEHAEPAHPEPVHTPMVMTTTDAATLLGRHVRTVQRLVRNGQLRAVEVGGRRMIRRADLELYVDSLPASPPGSTT